MKIDWPHLRRLPHSYILCATALTGCLSLVLWQGSRPIVWLSGGGVATAMVSSWMGSFRQQDKPLTTTDWLAPNSFKESLREWEANMLNPNAPAWVEVKQWAMGCQSSAAQIVSHTPELQISVLEAIHTVLELTHQAAEASNTLNNLQTHEYKALAQQHFGNTCDRLRATHQQLQQLQDQLMLSALTPETTPALPETLQTLISVNQQMLQSTTTEEFRP